VAEDLTSGIFEKILNSINDFQWQGITVSAWIFRIARNHVIDYYRKNSKHKGQKSIEDVANYVVEKTHGVDIEIQAHEEEIELYKAMREIKSKDQYLIYYKFYENLSNKEISKLSGLSETNIGTRLHRIRKRLLRIIKKNDAG